MATTPDGTVYVGVDENGSLDNKANRGRIVRCRDLNGDGKADEFKTFASMDSPRGIVVVSEPLTARQNPQSPRKTSLIVLHPPTLTAFHDDNGDGISDRSEVLVKGIGFDLKTRGADHTTNGIQVGIDGWIYVAVGDYGFVNAVGTDGQSVQLRGGGIARVRSDGTELEVVSRGQRNIYDVGISPTMDLFTRDNTNDGGGWNVRLSHVPQDAQMGYPSLFINFSDEIIQPLADYGGGSPCGTLYVDEPTLPGEIGHQLLTCDWGRSIVYRHPLVSNGAGFIAEQEPFIEIPRPTDIDVDASGNLYITSWKDGGFTFSGPNVGYVIKVKPPASDVETVAGFSGAFTSSLKHGTPLTSQPTDSELVQQLNSPSHTIRLNIQREILHRGDRPELSKGLQKLAASNAASLAVRVAAIFTLKQLQGQNSHATLLELSQDAKIREYALKAIADRKTQLGTTSIAPLTIALKDSNPRVRLAAARAIGRFSNASNIDSNQLQQSTKELVPLASDRDPLIAHIAIHSLVQLNAVEACLEALKDPLLERRLGALMALRHLYDPASISTLFSWLENHSSGANSAKAGDTDADQRTRQAILTTLCRLNSREAPWTGDWWGTRPDTSGPFYKPVAWSESERILKGLGDALSKADPDTGKRLLIEMKRHKIELPNSQSLIGAYAAEDSAFVPTAVELLSAMNSPLSEESGRLLERVASATVQNDEVRSKALRTLLRRIDQPTISKAGIRSFVSVDEKSQQGETARVWDDFIRESKLGAHLGEFVKLVSESGNQPSAVALNAKEAAYAVLQGLADNARVGKAERDQALKVVELAWTNPESTVSLLRAVGRSRAESQALQVRALRNSKIPEIRSAAEFAAAKMELDQEPAFDPKKPLIANLAYEAMVADAVNAKGDAKLGARLFTRQGCSACHTVSPTEPLKGPLLQDITKRYKKEELIESIVKPSAKIAQGFESQFFVTHEGKVFDGFVVRESGDEIEFRNVAGLATTLKKTDIDERGKREASIMPNGLVDKLNPDQLAAILAYLDSLKK